MTHHDTKKDVILDMPGPIMSVKDQDGKEHMIYGDEFAAFAIMDVLETIKVLEEENAHLRGAVQ